MENNQHNEKIGGMTALISKLIKKVLAGKDPATIHDPHGDFMRRFYTDEQRRAIFVSLPESCLFNIETRGSFIIGKPGIGIARTFDTRTGELIDRREYLTPIASEGRKYGVQVILRTSDFADGRDEDTTHE